MVFRKMLIFGFLKIETNFMIVIFFKLKYVGFLHFDWSYIEEKFPDEQIVTLLREPVSRAVSHFDFMKSLSWTKGLPIRSQNMSQFLKDPVSMLDCRGLWQDGQVKIKWKILHNIRDVLIFS